jgi:hypothetical protein
LEIGNYLACLREAASAKAGIWRLELGIYFIAIVSFFSTSDILSSIPLIEYPGRTPSHLHLPKEC